MEFRDTDPIKHSAPLKNQNSSKPMTLQQVTLQMY